MRPARRGYETPERRKLSRSCSRTWTRPRPRPRSLPRGTTFEALAAERGLKDTDIDLGTVAKTAVVDRAVGDAAFALKAGEVSAPIEGRFGIAIVKVDAIEPARTRPFEEVSAELKRELATEKAQQRSLASVQEKIEDERLGGATLAEAGKKFGLTPRVIEAIDRTGKDPSRQRRSPACPRASMWCRRPSPPTSRAENEPLRLPSNGGFVWYDVDSITASRERTLDEVKDQVLARWRDDEIANRLRAKSTEMLDKIKAGTSFADAAAADQLKVEWRPGIKRGSPPPGLSAAAVAEIFRTAKDAAGSVEGASPAERIVFRVTEIKVPALDPEAAEAKRIDEALRQRTDRGPDRAIHRPAAKRCRRDHQSEAR